MFVKINRFLILILLLLSILLFTSCPPADVNPPAPTPVPIEADEYEPDDDFASATEILYEDDSAGTYDQLHTLYPTGDNDWLYFHTEADEVYVIETYPVESGTDVDTILILYKSNGTTVINSDDDIGQGMYSKLIFSCSTTGTCYIRIYEREGNPGDYMVSVMHVGADGLVGIEIN